LHKIIASGDYSLAPEYFSIFGNDNHTNKELVFAVDQRPDLSNSHNRMAYSPYRGINSLCPHLRPAKWNGRAGHYARFFMRPGWLPILLLTLQLLIPGSIKKIFRRLMVVWMLRSSISIAAY